MIVMDEKLLAKLERVKKRQAWPAALLAEMLGRPRRYVYRMVETGRFAVLNDGGSIKITSESVIQYYYEEHHQIP